MTYLDQIVGVYCPDAPGVRAAITAIVEREVILRTAPIRAALIDVANPTRQRYCWCDYSHGTFAYGHQAKCKAARLAALGDGA